MKDVHLILDFDSTFVTVESLDLLAERALRSAADRFAIGRQVQDITRLGMEGKIPFSESLSRRLRLFRAHRTDVDAVAQELSGKISPSVEREADWIRTNADRIHIVSGGFQEMIRPVVEPFGIQHVHANRFVYDDAGFVIGADETTPFAHDHGKATALRALDLPGIVCVIGDGYTDYEMKSLGGAHHFLAFTENVSRDSVIALADRVISDFAETRNFTKYLPKDH